MGGKRITAEQVRLVKEYKEMYPNMRLEHLGKIAGIDRSSAGRICKGEYDELLEERKAPAIGDDDVLASIAESLRELVEILRNGRQVQTTLDIE